MLGKPELASAPRFESNSKRVENVDAIDALILAWTPSHELHDALAQLNAASIPAAPVTSIADIVTDPHMLARAAVARVSDEDGGFVATPGIVPAGTPPRKARLGGTRDRRESGSVRGRKSEGVTTPS